MANESSGTWIFAIIVIVALGLGVYYGYRKDGGGAEYGDLEYLPAA